MARILHVIPALWSGAGNVVTRLCVTQSERHEIAIVTSDRSGIDADWDCYRRTLSRHAVQHHPIDFLSRAPSVFWPSVEALGELIEGWMPQVVHTHAGVPAAGAAVARDREGRAHFRTVAHFYSWGVDRPSWMDQMDLWAFGRADAVVCSARAYERRLLEGGVDPSRVVYLPWGLSLDTLEAARRLDVSQGTQRVIGCVGRLEPRKRQLDLCEAFVRCRRRDPHLRLELVGPAGDADYARQIEEFVQDSSLEASILVRGQVKDVTRYLTSWDLAVSLSDDEGQGLAVLEAMATATPVLTRASAGLEDFMRDGENGFVLKGWSPDDVANAIMSILARPADARRVGRCGRQFVRQHYDWARTVTRLDELYDRPLEAGRERAA